MLPPPPRSTLFPYTTLFRSGSGGVRNRAAGLARIRQYRREPCGRSPLPAVGGGAGQEEHGRKRQKRSARDRKSTRLNSSHSQISYAVFCLKKKKKKNKNKGK